MSSSPPKNKRAIATRSVRAGLESDAQHGSVVPPIYLSTNFAFERYRKPRKYDYTRSGNPTRDQLAGALADLEGGAGAVVTCTGLSAITLILATLPSRARVIAPYDCYGTYRLLAALHAQESVVTSSIARRRNAPPRSRKARTWSGSRRRSNPPAAGGRHPRDCRRSPRRRPVGGRQHLPRPSAAAAGARPDMVMHSHTKPRMVTATSSAGGDRGDRRLQENLAWWANAIGHRCAVR